MGIQGRKRQEGLGQLGLWYYSCLKVRIEKEGFLFYSDGWRISIFFSLVDFQVMGLPNNQKYTFGWSWVGNLGKHQCIYGHKAIGIE